jgi:hypothetical protein
MTLRTSQDAALGGGVDRLMDDVWNGL